MESIHGVDVSWMHHKDNSRTKATPKEVENGDTVSNEPAAQTNGDNHHDGNTATNKLTTNTQTAPKPIPVRPGGSRTTSNDRNANGGQKGASPSPSLTRRNSWLSSLSSKFSSSPSSAQASAGSLAPPGTHSPTAHDLKSQRTPIGTPNAAAIQSNTNAEAEAPYTPAPPKSGQHNFLQSALRRLSSSGGQLSSGGKGLHHGICERRTLNIDPHRERCAVPELDQAKLRRVAFCVDVEIAGGPRYTEDDGKDKKSDKLQKKKITEKGEASALKHPEAVKKEKEEDGVIKASGETVPQETPTDNLADPVLPQIPMPKKVEEPAAGAKADPEAPETTKKKEKKKRSEEERKARKEKKRRQAEANGTVPVELVLDDSDSSIESTPKGPSTPKTQAAPTIDPVRIYRRCCQLRETPILKKITEQLAAPSNVRIGLPGVVSQLDLSSYWLSLPDLVTLGDYLAVVPVKELIMENCGLTDEGLRVILSGLLAARLPETMSRRRRRKNHEKDGDVHLQGGVIERLVLKNNKKLGRDGWRYLCLFMHMARSLKFLDLSMIPFPQVVEKHSHTHQLKRTMSNQSVQTDLATIMSKAIGDRLAGSEFELLNLAETGMNSEQLGKIINGISKCGLRRLGLAGNNIDAQGMDHIARWLKEGKCEGLDLGGNHAVDLEMIAASLSEEHPLWALSLADCDLTPDSLWKLFPSLSNLKNFRFIDVSHNHRLFEISPSAVSLFRRYLPKLPTLKRIHLTDTAMSPEQAVALAEIFPESASLAHVNLMENPRLAALADAKGEANQEEACALYASLMAAVRVSSTIVCIDIEVPSPESSEVVKALAKQVVAYCLRNMERSPIVEIGEAVAAATEPHGGEDEVTVPDVLLHLVGHGEGSATSQDDDELAPDEDYVIGGTGVVKALGICLNRGHDSRRPSHDRRHSNWSERAFDSPRVEPVSGGKAKDMSKNLLGSARKIRARLQPALLKESRQSDRHNYSKSTHAAMIKYRLLFLDQTLERMINRFEDEYPETRLPESTPALLSLDPENASPSETSILSTVAAQADESAVFANSDDEDIGGMRPTLSRHNSDVSLASKALSQEEGRMHRFGQQFRRDILRPQTPDHLHNTTGKEQEAKHLQMLRAMIEELGGEEIKRKVEEGGQEAVIKELGQEASDLRLRLMESDPEGWAKFKEAQEVAQKNNSVTGLGETQGLGDIHSAIEE